MERETTNLAKRLSERRPDAFNALYRATERDVLRYFIRHTRDADVAADLCAETFAQALVSLRRYDPSRGSPTAWLFGIARHQLASHFRHGETERRARERLGLEGLVLTDAQRDGIAALAEDIEVDEILDVLPRQQSAAVRARVLEERSYEDIAAEHGASEQTIRQRVSRGLASLRNRSQETRA